MQARARRAARFNTFGNGVSPRCASHVASQNRRTAFTVRHGNIVIHVHDRLDLDHAFSTLAKQVSLGNHFSGSVDTSDKHGMFADATSSLHNVFDSYSGASNKNLRGAMLSCRDFLDRSAVNWTNRLNDANKFARHDTPFALRCNVDAIATQLGHRFASVFVKDNLSTMPRCGRRFSRRPPGIFSLGDIFDEDVLAWHLAALADESPASSRSRSPPSPLVSSASSPLPTSQKPRQFSPPPQSPSSKNLAPLDVPDLPSAGQSVADDLDVPDSNLFGDHLFSHTGSSMFADLLRSEDGLPSVPLLPDLDGPISPAEWLPGLPVWFSGLKGSAVLNGTCGTLVEFMADIGRWKVHSLFRDDTILCKVANLSLGTWCESCEQKVTASTCPDCGRPPVPGCPSFSQASFSSAPAAPVAVSPDVKILPGGHPVANASIASSSSNCAPSCNDCAECNAKIRNMESFADENRWRPKRIAAEKQRILDSHVQCKAGFKEFVFEGV